ncbi:MAG TPA: MerR family transcriptional regulator [Rhizomicrobium sp.]|jgi:DNA-binding transcriptional MerR regulator|nr:MerR family transcriptional regulator [Rhizomicrobium sp.]
MAGAATLAVKSPEAFRTISEVAVMLNVPQHVLRFWETRFAHIRPIKRAGGRRFYRPEDVDLLRGIRLLLYFEGYTIKGVQKILREKGVRHTAALGREDAKKNSVHAAPDSPPEMPPCEDADEFDALATLAHVRDAAAESLAGDDTAGPPAPDDTDRRASLESLLAELLALKSRLAAARKAAVA